MKSEVRQLQEKGRRSLAAAKRLAEIGHSDFATSRAYYAMFYLAEAALLSRGLCFSRHSAVISAFGREFVSKGLIAKDLHQHLILAFDERNVGDYGLRNDYPQEIAADILRKAELFIKEVERFILEEVGSIRLGALLSGGGRTLVNIVEEIDAGRLHAEVVVVISSLPNVKGVERAKAAGLPVKIIRKKEHPDVDEFSRLIAETLDEYKVDLVCQAGWTCYWRIPDRWLGKVMNIHPALLPRFGGKGFFGHHVHEAVLAAGEKESGCTVHFANNEYDAGPIILQRKVPVLSDDDADTLAARVFEQECVAYPEAIRLFAEGRLRIKGDRVEILE